MSEKRGMRSVSDMNKWFAPCLWFLLSPLLTCCDSTKGGATLYKTIDTLVCEQPFKQIAADYVENIEYMPLSESNEHIITELTKFREHAERLYLCNKSQNKIVVYDNKGKYLYEINRIGKSEQEYAELISFTVDNNYIYTLDNYKHRINKYRVTDESFAGYTDMPFVAWDIEALGDDRLLFAYLPNNPHATINMEQPHGAVWITDSAMNVQSVYFPLEEGYYEMVGKSSYFSKSGKQIIFHSFHDNGYYIFDADKEEPLYVDVLFSNGIDERDKSNYTKVQESGYNYLAETPIVMENYVLTMISSDLGEEPFVANLKDKVFVRNSETSAHNALMPPVGLWQGKAVCYISDFMEYNDLTSFGYPRADKAAEERLEAGGACLLLYKMKE